MNRKLVALLLILGLLGTLVVGCGSSPQESEKAPVNTEITITDMAGREVTVPTQIDRVYATSAVGTVMLYTLAPDKMVGWNNALRDNEKKYIDAQYHNLPELGSWKGTSYTGNTESLLKTAPQLIISVGDVSPQYVSEAQDIEKQVGIPVVMVDGSLKNTAAAYRFIGKLLQEDKRAEELALYCDQTFAALQKWQDNLPDEQKVKLYYAEGMEGLETEVSGTVNSEAIDLAGAINLADPGAAKGARRIQVSLEQLLVWNPEVIIISTDGSQNHEAFSNMTTDGKWKNIQAVESGQVYEIPYGPYDWINRPPSVLRLLGVKWLAGVLYPDLYQIDINQETAKFMKLFFRVEPASAEIDKMLVNAVPR